MRNQDSTNPRTRLTALALAGVMLLLGASSVAAKMSEHDPVGPAGASLDSGNQDAVVLAGQLPGNPVPDDLP